MKFHSCPFLMEWKRSALFLLLKNKDKTVFWEFCFQASLLHSPSTEEKWVPLLQSCILEEPKSIHSSLFKNFSWPPVSPMCFSQLMFRAMLCADWPRTVLLDQSLWLRGCKTSNSPTFPWGWGYVSLMGSVPQQNSSQKERWTGVEYITNGGHGSALSWLECWWGFLSFLQVFPDSRNEGERQDEISRVQEFCDLTPGLNCVFDSTHSYFFPLICENK